MLKIEVKRGENINRALSRFKSLVISEGTLKDLRDKQFYVKPSLKKKLKREAAERQRIKDEIRMLRQIEAEENEWR